MQTKMLTDNHGRPVSYLRLAVTDQCNLRCFYCMPAEGLKWLPKKEILTYEELISVSSLLVNMGISKIRITGGEPFVRKDIMHFLSSLSKLEKLQSISITTNGVLTAPVIPELRKLGINSVNLSIDTLDRTRFLDITKRDELPAVLHTLDQLLYHGMEVKLNAVIMEGRNTDDIVPLAHLTRELPVSVRFIEEMPFNGTGHSYSGIGWDYIRIMETVKEAFPGICKEQDAPFSTSLNYRIPGHKGTVGVIPAYSRSFCGTCNRIRITPEGMLKTCLYDDGVLNIKDLIRQGLGNDALQAEIARAIGSRHKDGWEAEKNRSSQTTRESMAVIGG